MTTKVQSGKAEGHSKEATAIYPQKYIYQKNINTPNNTGEDRYIVTIERRFTSHWVVREVDASSGQLPRSFTVVPHQDLVPYGLSDPAIPVVEVRIDINSCSTDELIKACPGIGVAAHYIIDRRPTTLYQTLSQLKQLNQDLPIDWVGLNSRISFTSNPKAEK